MTPDGFITINKKGVTAKMTMQICGAPCCWGVKTRKNPYIPSWQTVMKEARMAGYSAVELGPYGYLPIDVGDGDRRT